MNVEVASNLHEEVEDGVVRWTLHAPARKNPVTPEALAFIERRCATLDGETVVLRGAGDEAFCAGFDLTALANAARPSAAASLDALPDAPLIAATAAMRRANATFVAAIEGYAIGAGVELACACDLRIARRGAWFQVPAARLGVVYHADGLARIRAVFGEANTAQLLMLGRRLDAEDAAKSGALVELVAADAFAAAVQRVITELARAAPLSLAANRELLRALSDAALPPARREAHDRARVAAYRSDDHREARAALAERRPPRFAGR